MQKRLDSNQYCTILPLGIQGIEPWRITAVVHCHYATLLKMVGYSRATIKTLCCIVCIHQAQRVWKEWKPLSLSPLIGAEYQNRTDDTYLEGRRFTIKLIPRKLVADFGIAPKLTSAYETDPALILVDPRLKNLNSFNKHTTTAIRRQELNPNREHRYCSWVQLQLLLL